MLEIIMVVGHGNLLSLLYLLIFFIGDLLLCRQGVKVVCYGDLLDLILLIRFCCLEDADEGFVFFF